MARQRDNELTVEQKLEIRQLNRKKKELGLTTQDIADKFNKSRQTISQVINNKDLVPLEQRSLDKEERKMASNVLDTLEVIHNKVLKRIDDELDNDKANLSALVSVLKEVNTQLRLMAGKPTNISESRKLSVDINKLKELPPEQIAEYLTTGDVKTIEVYESQREIAPENVDTDEIQAPNGGARELSTE